VKRVQGYESDIVELKKEMGLKVFEFQQRYNIDEKLKASIKSVKDYYMRL